MFDGMTAAFEAINFQTHSPTAKALTQLLQDVITYRDSLDYSKVRDNEMREYRIEKVHDYCRKTLFPGIQKLFKDNHNLTLTKILNPCDGMVCCFFAIDLSMDNVADAIEVITQYTGFKGANEHRRVRSTLKEMMEMSSVFDAESGRLTSDTFGKDNKRKISATLYFDVNAAFLAKDYLPNYLHEELTAAELAAILLHEKGHVMVMIERSGDFYAKTSRYTQHLQVELRNRPIKEVARELVDLTIECLTKVRKDKMVEPADADKIQQAAEGVAYFLREEESESFSGAAGSILIQFISQLCILLAVALLHFYGMWAVFWSAHMTQAEYRLEPDGKSSDQAKSVHNIYMNERLADEYVNRHGMGGPLASALAKLSQMGEVTVHTLHGTHTSQYLRRSRTVNLLIKCHIVLMRPLMAPFTLGHTYENLLARLERLSQNALAAFKADLPKEALAHYLLDYEQIQAEIRKNRSCKPLLTVKQFFDFIEPLRNPMTFLSMLLTGRLNNDYEKLQNQIEDIINNKLYYAGAKFKQLAAGK